MKFEINNPGEFGIIKDVAPYEMPNNAWSDGLNIHFDDGFCSRARGENLYYETQLTADDQLVYYVTPVRTDTTILWTYFGSQEAWVTDGTTHASIHTGAGASQYWSSGFLQGLLLATNEINPPLQWAPGLANQMEPLVYDTSAASTWSSVAASCRTLRTFKQYGVALDTTESGVRNSRRVWWSHPADAGNSPPTWDYSKAAFDAGQVELDDEPEPLIDCLPLRGDNIIYKRNQTYRMTEIGPPFIFSFNRIFRNIGIRSKNCVKEFFGNHVVFGFEDIIIHDGQTHKEVLDRKMRRWLINNIDDDNSDLCTVVVDHMRQEVYFCFPEVGQSYLTKAIIWNWKDGTTTIKELNNKTFMVDGLISETGSGTTFQDDVGPFSTAAGPFDQVFFTETNNSLMSSDSLKRLLAYPRTMQRNGADYESYVERTSLPLPGRQGRPDNKELKFIKRLYPRITGTGANVTISLAEQNEVDGPVFWKDYTFNPATDYKLDCRVTTRLPGIRVKTASGPEWHFHGVVFEYDNVGFR